LRYKGSTTSIEDVVLDYHPEEGMDEVFAALAKLREESPKYREVIVYYYEGEYRVRLRKPWNLDET
jgi:hypothetical protein